MACLCGHFANKLDSSRCWSSALSRAAPLVANHREDVCQTLSSMGERVNAEGTSDESHFPWKEAQVRCFEGRVGYVVDHPNYLWQQCGYFSIGNLVLAFKLAPRHSPTQ